MLPTATGAIVILVGIWCQFGDYRRTLVAMMILTLFEAADAADLVALGGATVTPAKLFLLFFVVRLISMRGGGAALLGEIAPGRVLYIYLLLILWVVASGLLLPRLFEGATQVFSLDRATIDIGAIPLKPSTGNITQGVYAMGGFVLAVGISVLARKPGGYATVLTGLLWITGLDIFFAVFDLVTAATHTEFLLDLIHTGNYAFLTSDEVGGLKRISGTFSETSAFASFSLELLAINLALFVARVKPWLTASFCAALLAFLGLSTSTTAYVGLALFGFAFGVEAIYVALRYGKIRHLAVFGGSLAMAVFLVCLVVLFAPKLAAATGDLLDMMVFQKSQSDSGIERAEANAQSLKVFFDTFGLGSGIGSSRASNFLLVIASNLGLIGLCLFGLLIGALALARLRPDLARDDAKIVMAARAGMLGTLVPATLNGTVFDLGTLFYILVGIAASGCASRAVAAVHAPAPPQRFDGALGARR